MSINLYPVALFFHTIFQLMNKEHLKNSFFSSLITYCESISFILKVQGFLSVPEGFLGYLIFIYEFILKNERNVYPG